MLQRASTESGRAPAFAGLLSLLLCACGPSVLVDQNAASTSGAGGSSGIGGSGGIGGAGGTGSGPPVCTGVEHWASLGPIPGAVSALSATQGAFAADRMFVWGLPDPTVGGVYDVKASAWAPVPTDVLSPRQEVVVAAAGGRFVVWGGFVDGSVFGDGAISDAAAGTWTPTASEGAPKKRRSATAVSTGNRILVWGGRAPSNALGTGASLDVATNAWTPITQTGAPEERFWHSAVWTGSTMIVWGGVGGGTLKSGGVYDPATDTWKPTSTAGAPLARSGHRALWTGSRMLIWGGQHTGSWPKEGGSYDPATDTWAPMSIENAPAGRENHVLLWTGKRMILAGGWGGEYDGGPGVTFYDPAADAWTAAPLPPPDVPTGMAIVGAWNGCAAMFWGLGPTGTQIVAWMYEPPPGG